MKLTPWLKSTAALSVLLISLVACDDDFSEVGSSIVDNNNFDALLFDEAQLEAYSQKINRIQTNRLQAHNLGVFNDPVYGQTTANILTQLRLDIANPDFGDNPELDSVVLSIPYYATITDQGISGRSYRLDSVYGEGSIDLAIYESNYYLRTVDPNNDFETQLYYSDQMDLFEQQLNPQPIYEFQGNFSPSADEVKLVEFTDEGDKDSTLLSPRLRVKLPIEYFEQKILNQAGNAPLLSQENFRNHLRGLYFKVEAINDEGVGMTLNLNPPGENEDVINRANITMYITNTSTDVDGSEYETQNEFNMTFGPNIVNVYESDYESLPDAEQLYVKGGQGSMAVIDLFTNVAQLDSIRSQNWLVNEANLTFYVDENQVPEGNHEPQRLFIYDLNNQRVLKDFTLAADVSDVPELSRTTHLGRLSKDDDGNRYYKLRITDYINDIINNDSTNTRLGVVASKNINIASPIEVEVANEEEIDQSVSSASFSLKGTVLHGTNAPNSSKTLKLNIFYTEPN